MAEAEIPWADLTGRHIVLPNTWPLYVASPEFDLEAIAADALEKEFSYYYVLGAKKSKLSAKTTALYKVVTAFCGYATIECEDHLGLAEGIEAAFWTLPPIPRAMVDRIENFFRTVHTRHQTEAIVMLGYDTRLEGSAGWCVLVPNQENTASSCDYKYESVVEQKDDEVVIVGSAHSHPGMSAFASGTDHKDQASFDGLHVTYGWFGRRIEYHLELTLGGRSFALEEDQVFEAPPKSGLVEEVEDWLSSVKKKWGTTGAPTPSASESFTGNLGQNPRRKTPSGWPSWAESVCVIELLENQKTCPVCRQAILPGEMDSRRCMMCNALFCLPGESWADFYKIRRNKFYLRELDPEATNSGIYIMRQERKKEGKNEWVEQKPQWIVEEPTASSGLADQIESEIVAREESLSPTELATRNICCGLAEDHCVCPTVYHIPAETFSIEEILLDGENESVVLRGGGMGPVRGIYSQFSSCDKCVYFASPSCRPLRRWTREYLETLKIPNPIFQCREFQFKS